MLINLTPHEIHELDTNTILPALESSLRIFPKKEHVAVVEGIEIFRSVYGESNVEIPPRQEGVLYIVSALTLNAIPLDRDDFVAPGHVVKDGNKILGCRGFRTR